MFPLLNTYARVPVCGVIAQYNAIEGVAEANWVPALMRGVLSKRMTVRGFIVSDFYPRFGEFAAEIVDWVKAGSSSIARISSRALRMRRVA